MGLNDTSTAFSSRILNFNGAPGTPSITTLKPRSFIVNAGAAGQQANAVDKASQVGLARGTVQAPVGSDGTVGLPGNTPNLVSISPKSAIVNPGGAPTAQTVQAGGKKYGQKVNRWKVACLVIGGVIVARYVFGGGGGL